MEASVSYQQEGSMRVRDDDDSESSSDDESVSSSNSKSRSGYAANQEPYSAPNREIDDDEDELEVFDGSHVARSDAKKEISKENVVEKPNSLDFDAFPSSDTAADVHESQDSLGNIRGPSVNPPVEGVSEQFANGEAQDQSFVRSTVVVAEQIVPTHNPSTAAPIVEEEEDDEFGQWSEDVPVRDSQPASVPAKAFSQPEADSDFKVDFSEELAAIEARKEELRTAAKGMDFDDDFSAGVASSSDLDLIPQFIQKDAPKSQSIQEQAAQALQDIVNVYGTGLGDQEVALLSLSEEDAKDKRPKKPAAKDAALLASEKNKGLMTITEDEEEAEEDETNANDDDSPVSPPSSMSVGKALDVVRKVEEVPVVVEEDEFDVAMSSAPAQQRQQQQQDRACPVPMSYRDAEHAISAVDVSAFEGKVTQKLQDILEESNSGSSSSWMPSFFKSSSSASTAAAIPPESLKQLWLFAEVDYAPSVMKWQLSLMQTLYCRLVCEVGDGDAIPKDLPGTVDPRWEYLGFQGSDPRTDLNRSMRSLALLQALHFVETQPVLARALMFISASNTKHPLYGSYRPTVPRGSKSMDNTWPFLCVSLAMTREALCWYTRDTRIALDAKQVPMRSTLPAMRSIHVLHHTLMVSLLKFLVDAPTVHHAEHMATLRQRCLKDPSKILRKLAALHEPQDRRDALRGRLLKAVEALQAQCRGGASDANTAAARPQDADLVFTNLDQVSTDEAASDVKVTGKAKRFQVSDTAASAAPAASVPAVPQARSKASIAAPAAAAGTASANPLADAMAAGLDEDTDAVDLEF